MSFVRAAPSIAPETSPRTTPASARRSSSCRGTGKHLVLRRGPDVVGQMEQILRVDPAELVGTRVPAEHTSERLGRHLRVGLTRRGVLADVGGDAVELLERGIPTPRPRPTRVDQRPVDVEQHNNGLRHRAVHVNEGVLASPEVPDPEGPGPAGSSDGAWEVRASARRSPLRVRSPRTSPRSARSSVRLGARRSVRACWRAETEKSRSSRCVHTARTGGDETTIRRSPGIRHTRSRSAARWDRSDSGVSSATSLRTV